MEDSFAESAASVFLLSSPKQPKETIEEHDAGDGEVMFTSLKTNQVAKDLKIKSPVFLHTTFLSSNKIVFILCNGIKLWKGELGQADLEQNANELNESVTTYILTAKKALGNSAENLSLSIKNGNKTDVELSWDRILEDNSDYTLGSTNLSLSTESNAVAAFIKNSCCFTEKLQTDLKLANVKQQKLSSQNKRLQAELEKCSEIKTELEYNLLNKFVQILNEKKAKIKSLEDEVIQLQSKQGVIIQPDVSPPSAENKDKAHESSCGKKETGRRRRKIVMSSLDDSDSFLTSSPPKARKVMPPMLRPEDVPPIPSEASDDLPDTVPNAVDMLDEM